MSHVILVLEVEDGAVTHSAVGHSDVAAPVLNQERNSGKDGRKKHKNHGSTPG